MGGIEMSSILQLSPSALLQCSTCTWFVALTSSISQDFYGLSSASPKGLNMNRFVWLQFVFSPGELYPWAFLFCVFSGLKPRLVRCFLPCCNVWLKPEYLFNVCSYILIWAHCFILIFVICFVFCLAFSLLCCLWRWVSGFVQFAQHCLQDPLFCTAFKPPQPPELSNCRWTGP